MPGEAATAGDIVLQCWFHPSMRMPFPVGPTMAVRVTAATPIIELMEKVESLVEGMSVQEAQPVQMQIQVLWNTKASQKALSPTELVGSHFLSGDTFGIYGECIPVPKERPSIPEEQKLPVTILTGFLGAGKTTLLNYILREQKEKKIAVIENEFGEVSIDDALLKQDKLALAEKVVVMDNGCMCCTVRGDLQSGLQQILDEVHRGSKIDSIMIETTGMADPVPIVRTFMTTPDISAELRLDGVITVADAKHVVARLDDKVEEGKVNEAYQQVAFCDKLLLNKLDLVTAEQAIAVKDRLRAINAFAKILPSVKGHVKMTELTDLRAHDMANFINENIEEEAEQPKLDEHGHGGHGGHAEDGHAHDACAEDHGHEGGHHGGGHGHGEGHEGAHGHVAKKSRHDSRVNSFSVVREGEILPERLSQWMQTIGQLPEEKGVIFRIKGILAVKGHPFKHVFHAVMDVSDEDDAGPWLEGERKVSKMVFIGKGMDQKFIRDGFEGIFEK